MNYQEKLDKFREMCELEKTLHPIRKAIEYNYLANQTLGNLRDSLLPKLMSGELDISMI